MTTLARKLGVRDYFSLAFGAMIGVGWLVLMDDWLGRGGSLGAALAFAIGGLLLIPVGLVYGKWVERLPDASGEAAYTAQVFPPFVSYFTGWIMLLAYFIVCPWEAVAAGKLAAYLIPSLDTLEIYRVAGQPIFLPRLLLGIGMTLFLCILNYRGIRASATFQKWITTAVLLLFAVVVFASGWRGSPVNFHPAFAYAPLVSILLTLQIVPYFLTGFESVPKAAEEASPGFRTGGFRAAILLALLVGAAFYVLAVLSVAYVAPWQDLIGQRFATAIAFERAWGTPLLARFILGIAVLGLFQVFNGNFVASTRLFFAFGRSGTIPSKFGKVHPRFQTPNVAVLAITVGTLAGVMLGDALLVPVTEVGSMASAFGWTAACVSLLVIEKNSRTRFVAALGAIVALTLMLMKILPVVPGHFSRSEWVVLAGWIFLGATFWQRRAASVTPVPR